MGSTIILYKFCEAVTFDITLKSSKLRFSCTSIYGEEFSWKKKSGYNYIPYSAKFSRGLIFVDFVG